MVLGALRQFEPARVIVTTMQALSGAGYPGVASLDALGNVIPYIGGAEEEKIETETLKLLGRFESGAVTPARFTVSAAVNRVPVPDGHTAVMSIELKTKPSIEEVRGGARRVQRRAASAPAADRARETRHPAQRAGSAAAAARRERSAAGMPVHVGRVRACPILGYKLVAMGHNVVRGRRRRGAARTRS